MSYIRRLTLVILTVFAATAQGQQAVNDPHIGYLYPAGGQQGSTVLITIGGQFLRGAVAVRVTGPGVHGSIIKYMPVLRNINTDQRKLLVARLKELRDKRLAELSQDGRSPAESAEQRLVVKQTDKSDATNKQETAETAEVKMPEHPLLYDLDNKSLAELAHIASLLFFPRERLQMNRQISEFVLLEITIDPNAEPGDRELRLQTATGLTNPIVFQVGVLPEVRELEPNNRQAYLDLATARSKAPLAGAAAVPAELAMAGLRDLPERKPVEPPVVLNGQIMPGDVDRFRIRVSRGQKLVMQVHARSLIPYLADAVPGWFQPTLALYNAQGKEVAYADDYRFNPDPVLFYEIPEDGEYELEICDSLYRGREDFVYRIAVSEQPFITRMFPLGGTEGVRTIASIAGWNLPRARLALNTRAGGEDIRRTVCREGKQFSNSVSYTVDTLADCNEIESNNSNHDAQQIEPPKIINGRIEKPDDVDVFRFQGRTGEKIAVEVYARRLNSPLDSLVRLTDTAGNVIAWNDDHVIEKNYLYENVDGLLTHHADSYLTAELPKDAEYFVQLSDSQNHGGQAYAYRLRIAKATGDFALRVTPSNLSVRAGGIIPVWVHALRKDGFDGDIEVALKDTPAGFKLDGARIPAGRDSVRITLAAPTNAPDEPVALQLEGRAQIDGQTIRRPAVPADDVMQAFLYRHLVPAQEFLVFVQKVKWGVAPPVALAGDVPVKIPAGGSAHVQLRAPRRTNLSDIQIQLNQPPAGVSLGQVNVAPDGLTFEVKADKELAKAGFADNLIIEAFRETIVRAKDGTPTKEKRRFSTGLLPAVPIQIVAQ